LKKTALVIGSGFAGLSAAACLAKAGFKTRVLEKNNQAGGRARQFKAEGFTFDMGPSWYWMPDVFEKYFALFGKKVSDYYQLKRLDPSYRVYFSKSEQYDLPASMDELYALFEEHEPGSSKHLKSFLDEAAYKYEVGINDLVYKPSRSLTEFIDARLLYGLVKMDVFNSISSQIRSKFKNKHLVDILEFPVLFLGAKPEKTPALYSLMNYADMALGTWYPANGMHEIVKAMVTVAEEQGVEFLFNQEVTGVELKGNRIDKVLTTTDEFEADVVIGGADYHHIDQQILPPSHRAYSASYWDSRVMAPSSLIFYLGIDKKLQHLLHHNLFFDADFGLHADEIYENPKWPTNPLFYVSAPSQTDTSVAPDGCENIFILIPVAPGIDGDDEATRMHYYNKVMDRLEAITEQNIRDHVIYNRSYAHADFESDYHAFKGNAYGLANTLKQTAILKPALKSKKVKNLYYTGQLTVPGPGVPPSIISGQVVAKEIEKDLKP